MKHFRVKNPSPSNGAFTRLVWLIHLVFLLHPEAVIAGWPTCHKHVYNSTIDGCPPANPQLPILNISIDCNIGKVLMVSRTDYAQENFNDKQFAEIQLELSYFNDTIGLEEREIILRDGYKPLQDFPLPDIDLDEELTYEFTACMVFHGSACWIMNKQNLSCNPVVQTTATSDLSNIAMSSSFISSTLQSLLLHPYSSASLHSTIITYSTTASTSQHPLSVTSQTLPYSTITSSISVVKPPPAETTPSTDNRVIIIVSIVVPGVIVGFGVVVVLVVCFISIKGRRVWFKSQEDKTYFETTAYSAIIPIDNLSMTGSIATIYEGVQIEPSLLLHPPPMYTEQEPVKELALGNSINNKIGDQKVRLENLKNNANSQYMKKVVYKNEINSSAGPKKHPPLQTETSASSINHAPHSRSHTVSCSDEGYLGTMQSLTDDETMFSEGTSDLDHSMSICCDENDMIFQENMSTITEAISPMDENHPSSIVWPSPNTQVIPEQNKALATTNNATDGYIPDENTSGEAYSTSTVPLSTEEDSYYRIHEEGQPIKASAPINSDGYIPDEQTSGEPSTMTLCTEEDPYYRMHEEGQPIKASVPTNSDEHTSGEPSTVTLCTEEDPYYRMHEEGMIETSRVKPSFSFDSEECFVSNPHANNTNFPETVGYTSDQESIPITLQQENTDGYISDNNNYSSSFRDSTRSLPCISLPVPGKMISDVTTTIDLTESTGTITKGSNALTLTTNKAVTSTGNDELLPMNIVKDLTQITDSIPKPASSPSATMATDGYTTLNTGITMPTTHTTPVTGSYDDIPMFEGADTFETDFNHSSISLSDHATGTRDMMSSYDSYIAAGQGDDDTSCGFSDDQRALSNTAVAVSDGYISNSMSNPLPTSPMIDTTDYIDSTSVGTADDRVRTDPCSVSISIEDDDYITTTTDTRPSPCLSTQYTDQPSLAHPSKGVSHMLTTNSNGGYISSDLQSPLVHGKDSSYFTTEDVTTLSREPCYKTSSHATPTDHPIQLRPISSLNPTITSSSQTGTPSEYVKSPSNDYITSDPTTASTDNTLLHSPQLSTEPPNSSGLQDYVDYEPFPPLHIDTDSPSIPSHQHYHTTIPSTVQNWSSPSNDGYIS